MANTATQQQSTSVPRQEQRRLEEPQASAWQGWVAFGGIMMILSGFFGAIEGLVGIFKDQYFLVHTNNGLLVTTNYNAWGWTHLAIGVVVILAGLGVLAGQMWARVIGIGLAMISAVVNLAFLSAYPVWSTIIITLDVIVIYALAVHGGEVKSR
ncbi:MAG TPA: hypothetical protein VLR26_15130 [Frankiaceae bacterium]|nr:hypothetical protein [Frankiaceae bacterium]